MKKNTNVTEELRDFAANITDIKNLSKQQIHSLNEALRAYRNNKPLEKSILDIAMRTYNNSKKPEIKEITTQLKFEMLPENKMIGFHADFLTGSTGSGKKKEEFVMAHNAGMGGKSLYFTYKDKQYSADVSTLIGQLVNAIHHSEKQTPKKKK